MNRSPELVCPKQQQQKPLRPSLNLPVPYHLYEAKKREKVQLHGEKNEWLHLKLEWTRWLLQPSGVPPVPPRDDLQYQQQQQEPKTLERTYVSGDLFLLVERDVGRLREEKVKWQKERTRWWRMMCWRHRKNEMQLKKRQQPSTRPLPPTPRPHCGAHGC